jgi:hypothetical protein
MSFDLGRAALGGLAVLVLLAGDTLASIPSDPCAPPAALAEAAEAAPPLVSRVRLAWRDASGTDAAFGDAVGLEVRGIFGPAGVDVEWRVMGDGEETREGEIAIILLEQAPPGAFAPGVMGAVNQYSQARGAWVFLSTVERLVGGKARSLLAQAVGRVVAHEVVHVVAPALRHTSEGLMQAAWHRDVAVRPGMGLDDRAARAFLSALQPAYARCPAPGPVADEPDTIAEG